MRSKLLRCSYVLVVFALFLYSFTQIDLSLTASRVSIIQSIEKSFQYLGYFNRPLSTLIYVLILLALFSFYGYFLREAWKKRLSVKQIWTLILTTAVVLAISYNAFSYDIFNYIFDAKIITHYHQNPYFHKALDYPGDPMLSFMHWTHRNYPYGPIWLVLTSPISFLGNNIFIPTFFLFKFMMVVFYLGSCNLIYKINKKLNPDHASSNLILFALNPLVIIESLVSGHNDIAMIFFALLGLHLLFSGRKILALIVLIISSQIKIPTVGLLLPGLLVFLPLKYRFKNNKLAALSVLSMVAVSIYVITKIEIQPWYFLWIIPFLALLKPNKYITALIIGTSFGLLLRYTPYLYFGNWDGIAVQVKGIVTLLFPFTALTVVFLYDKLFYGKNKKTSK